MKNFPLILLLSVVTITNIAGITSALAIDRNQWVRDKNGCRAYNPNPHPKAGESIRWSGMCKGGYAEGPGLLEWFDKSGAPDGWRKGTLVHGNLQGYGEAQTAKGGHYRGQFLDGMEDGHGVFIFVDGTRYDGEFRQGAAEGHGTLIWLDGTRFDGELKAGKRNGHGAVVVPSGARFDGTFKDGRIDGRGTITWPDGARFEGDFGQGLCMGSEGLQSAKTDSSECADSDGNACKAPSSAISRSHDDQVHESAHSPALFCAAAAKALTSPIYTYDSLNSSRGDL